jgi:hypothetical protein
LRQKRKNNTALVVRITAMQIQKIRKTVSLM